MTEQTTMTSRESILERIAESYEKLGGGGDAADFVGRFYRHVATDELRSRSAATLAGVAAAHRELAEVRQPGTANVRVFNPTTDDDGWSSGRTVVQIVTDDMPFLVDSITMVVYRHGLVIHRLVHPLLGAERDGDGKLQRALPRGAAGSRPESWIHIEIDRVGDGELIDGLRHEIAAVLGDVRAAVDDGATMQQRMHEAHAELMTAPVAESDEAAA